jgi:hypothetical protein
MSYEQRPIAGAEWPRPAPSCPAGYPAVRPPLNQAAVVDASQLIGWPSAASRTRMLFQLRHFQVTALRPAAALPVSVHDRHNVSTLVDEGQPTAVQAWSATQKINVRRAGRLCGTQ